MLSTPVLTDVLSTETVAPALWRVYNNKSMMALLGIKDRDLKRLRNNELTHSVTPDTETNTGTHNPTSTAFLPAASCNIAQHSLLAIFIFLQDML